MLFAIETLIVAPVALVAAIHYLTWVKRNWSRA
jgi:hypothetical protein